MSKARNLSDFISDATVDSTEIADLSVTHAKLHTDMNLSSKTLTFAANQISGNSVDGGVISNFASTGIDDNANSTAVTIDSSGNLLVGTTTPFVGGVTLSPLGVVQAERNNISGVFNRTSTDGDIIQFRKDGSPVGSIASGSSGNEFKWYGSFASGAGLGVYSNVSIRPLSNTGAASDGTVTLGHSSQRFNDIHLSGAAYSHTAFQLNQGSPLKLQNAAASGFATIQNAGAGTNTDLSFNTNNSERMRIENGGDIKIINPAASPVNGVNLPGALVFEGNGWNTTEGSRPLQGQIHLWGGYSNPTGGSVEPALVFSLKGTGNGSYSTADGPDVLTERMRLDNYGKLGIGVTPYADSKVTIGGTVPSYSSVLMFDNNTTGGAEFFMLASDNTWSAGAGNFYMGHGAPSSGNIDMSIDGAGYIVAKDKAFIATSSTQRSSFYSGGDGAGLYTQNAYSSCGTHMEIANNAAHSWSNIYLHKSWSSGQDQRMIAFMVNSSTVGTITSNASSTSYATSSDYRLKENVVGLTGASARVNQLNPSRFNFIADDTNTLVDGFLAHEVATVVPEAITGTHDGMKDEEYEVTPAVLDDDGNVTTEAVMGTRSVPDYQGIDQSKLVPLLTAALQEALTEIASLKTRVEALE